MAECRCASVMTRQTERMVLAAAYLILSSFIQPEMMALAGLKSRTPGPLIFLYIQSGRLESESTACLSCASVELSRADDESCCRDAKREHERCLPSALCSVVSALRTRRRLSLNPCSAGAHARYKTVNGGRRPPPPSCHIFFPFGVFW